MRAIHGVAKEWDCEGKSIQLQTVTGKFNLVGTVGMLKKDEMGIEYAKVFIVMDGSELVIEIEKARIVDAILYGLKLVMA